MIVRIEDKTKLENPRGYPESAVEDLRALLTAGAVARPDQRRANFCEVNAGESTFYIHMSPVTGNVTLVAGWLRAPQPTTTEVEDCMDFSECC